MRSVVSNQREAVKKALLHWIMHDLQEQIIKYPVISMTKHDLEILVKRSADLFLNRLGLADRPLVHVEMEHDVPSVRITWPESTPDEVGH